MLINIILDIGANLTDPMYKGIYNGNKKHKEDLEEVLERSWKNGIKKIIITGGSLDDSIEALKIASSNGNYLLLFYIIAIGIKIFIFYFKKILKKIFTVLSVVIQHVVMNLIMPKVQKHIYKVYQI